MPRRGGDAQRDGRGTRGIIGGGSQSLKELDESITGTVSSGCTFDGLGLGEHRLLQSEVGIEIDLSCLDRFMPEPDRNQGPIDSGLKKLHCSRVPKDVGSNTFSGQRRADLLGLGPVSGNQSLDSVGAEASSARTGEQERRLHRHHVSHPRTQHRHYRSTQWRTAILTSLARAAGMGPSAEYDVAPAQPGDLGEPKPRLNGRHKQCMVPPSEPCRSVDYREEDFDLIMGQVVDDGLDVTLQRDGEYSLDQRSMLRSLHRCISEERADRGQSQIAAPRAAYTSVTLVRHL